MAGTLIALESTNQQLLNKTARYLALKLQTEGKSVEVLSFPQAKQSSGHFVQSHQNGEYGQVNPYAASMFYILDRYDASPQIRQFLEQDVIVICKSYRGTSLAELGAQISDAETRKGFYIWADSLESGTFSVPRPDVAIVLSEELPTLYELCELFPKDYIFAIDPTKIRNMLNKLIPPAPAVRKKQAATKISWIDALRALGEGRQVDFAPTNSYVTLANKSSQHKAYAKGLHELEELKKIALSKLPEAEHANAGHQVTPVGHMGATTSELPQRGGYKNRILTKLIAQNFESNYGELNDEVCVVTRSYRNELGALPELLSGRTEQNISELIALTATMPITKKIELYKAYLAGYDNDPADYSLAALQLTVALRISYADLWTLARKLPSIRFSFQEPTPRWGYDITKSQQNAEGELENCYLASLKLFSELEAANEPKAAKAVVLQGHFTQAVVTLDGSAMRNFAAVADQSSALQRLQNVITEQFPIISS